ncbi:hypothetical protein P12x_003394 [Tundrisphaera lichenicola]|uniref:hypothetical protein n=1 Tax=Tundrisphaera lichenicola TaxID=2029860 RepID=UPI003EB9F3EB
MRWIYYNENAEEAAEREEIVARIDARWRAFEGKVGELKSLFNQETRWDLPRWMDDHLRPIHPKIMWEYGPAVCGDGHRLVLTPESARELRPLVDKILERAPSITGWEFYDARLPEDLESTQATVSGRASYDIDDFLVRASVGDKRLIDLCYYSPNIETAEDEAAFNAAFVATETLLGENCLDRWIGAIEIRPDPKAGVAGRGVPRHAIKLDRLKETVDAAIASIRDQLPPTPHHDWAGGAEWTMWKLEPEPADDFYGQADLFVGKPPNPAMWIAAHSGSPFDSERFTRCGETFCYLKIDGAEGLGNSKFTDKGDIEDALDEALIPRGLGCQVGGGMGLRYAYIDLALTDVPVAITSIRERLQVGGLPKRSWILFFDSDLANEWVGVYDDTPEPPGCPNNWRRGGLAFEADP